MKKRQFAFACSIIFASLWNGFATTHYVDVNGSNPTPPYLDWSGAATNIQDAVDVASTGDLVLVSNGVYSVGGNPISSSSLTNRLIVNQAITVQSVNGPAVTTIQGYQPATTNGPSSIRCVWLADGAALSGFTLSGGSALAGGLINDTYGGGIWCASTNVHLTNCIMISNAGSVGGGGVYQGTLFNCLLTNNLAQSGAGSFGSVLSNCVVAGNFARVSGGGSIGGSLDHCTISDNRAPNGSGGGVAGAVVSNCFVKGNTATNGGGVYNGTTVNSVVWNNIATSSAAGGGGGGAYFENLFNCTVVQNVATNTGGGLNFVTAKNCIVYFNTAYLNAITGGSTPNLYDNSTNSTLDHCCTFPLPPGIANFTNQPAFANQPGSDFHLQPNSPCINAGNNASVSTDADPDGNPRIAGGTVDVGAYEFPSPTSVLSYAWAQRYGIPTDGTADFADSDGDGINNWQEWIAGTNPTNLLSALTLLPPAFTNAAGVTITWQSVTNQTYYVLRATNLNDSSFLMIRSNIFGQAGFTSFLDTTAARTNNYFYRVGIQQPYVKPVN